MKSKPRFPLVEVEWEDSVFLSRWREPAAAETERCHSAGYLISSDRRAVCVATSCGGEDVGGSIIIPRVAVKSIKRLKRGPR